MPSFASKSLLAALAGAASVAAHGHVDNIVINGVNYRGYDPTSFPYMSSPPTVIGWTAQDTDNGFVDGTTYATGDIICHKNGTNAQGYATVAAGDKISLLWNTWPTSHKGPILDYMAPCGTSGCGSVDKTTLEFFKIDAVGLVSGTTGSGTWATDQLIANNNSWLIEIPPTIAPGEYVLRHEIIALHSAGSVDGAQNYPQCFNLKVTGTGTDSPTGTLGEALYSPSDAGLLVNIYGTDTTYSIPGPTVISAGVSLSQAGLAATAFSSATAEGAAAAAATGTAAAGGAATTSAAAGGAATTSAAAAANTSAAGAAKTSKTAVAAVTHAATKTGSAATKTGSPAGGAAPTKAPSCKKRRSHARDMPVAV